MTLEIKDEKILYLDNKEIYRAKIKIYDAEFFDDNKIVIHIKAMADNLLCINKQGKLLWIAESVTPLIYSQYQAFDIRDGYIYGGVDLPGYGRTVKLDPNNGKILEQEITK
jgi:hypothetical protein